MEGEAITTVSTEERRNRRTDLTSEQRRAGMLDARFHEAGPGVSAADMEKLREILQPTPEAGKMREEAVLQPWNAERVRRLAAEGAANNTAPGHSDAPPLGNVTVGRKIKIST